MTLHEAFHWLQFGPIGRSIGGTDPIVGVLYQVAHVLGLVLFLATVLLINLRILGIGLRSQSLRQVHAAASPLLWIGLSALLLSGALGFASNALGYYANPAFVLKMVLLLFAISLQIAFHRKAERIEAASPVVAKSAAAFSLTLWFGVALAGRAIGFI